MIYLPYIEVCLLVFILTLVLYFGYNIFKVKKYLESLSNNMFYFTKTVLKQLDIIKNNTDNNKNHVIEIEKICNDIKKVVTFISNRLSDKIK